jgi:hypothetical protein
MVMFSLLLGSYRLLGQRRVREIWGITAASAAVINKNVSQVRFIVEQGTPL